MSNPAETYERYMVPVLFAPFARRLVDVANPQAGERVLDVACGTGIVARLAAARVGPSGSVTGLDLNPNMLAVARTKAEDESLSIAWDEGRAERLPFTDGSFDLVLCQAGLMFFTDRQAALTEMYRVLVDGGRVAVSVWQEIDRHPFYKALDAAFQRHIGISSVQDIFALGDADHLRTLLTNAGFQQVEITPVSVTAHFPDPESFLAGEIDVDAAAIPAMQQMDVRQRQELTEAIREDMEAPLREQTQDDHVVIPFHANIARGHRPL